MPILNQKASSGGGSSAYGTSYLGSFGAAALTVTNVAQDYAFDHPADLLVGTDLSISNDGKTITFATAGWYSVYVDTSVGGVADTVASVAFQLAGTWDAADIVAAMNGSFQVSNNLRGSVGIITAESVLVLPGFNFKAGDTLKVQVTGANLAGTAPTANGNIIVVRVA